MWQLWQKCVNFSCFFFSFRIQRSVRHRDWFSLFVVNLGGMEEAVLNKTILYLTHDRTGSENNFRNVTPQNEINSDSVGERPAEIRRLIYVTMFPFLIIFGSVGNLLTFVVMRRGSMKHVSTCFYMAILALADTGKIKRYHSPMGCVKIPKICQDLLRHSRLLFVI